MSIDLGGADFAAAVPFGFVADASGRIEVLGVALQRLLQGRVGQQVHELFQVVRPWRARAFVALPLDPRATVVLKCLGAELQLKGNTVAVGGGRIGFLGSPVVRDIEEFQRCGLHLSDFPPSDATPDLLLSMQATRTALEDARKLGAELEQALAEARDAMDAKARFLAMMSHEIRTPLNGFGSMIDLLRDSQLQPEQLENLETMDLCARSLLLLVNDILEFSKLEVGKVALVPRPADLGRSLARIVDHFRAAARERGVALDLRVEGPPGAWVDVDVERIRQVLANLVGNALKFTQEGGVTVHAVGPQDGLVTIDVVDTGVGIPAESVPRLFEPFVQADSSTTRRFGGTGLGLTISRQLAHALGGDVQLVRTGSDGSCFRFTFAAPECAPIVAVETDVSIGAAASFGGASVLVADDDSTNQLIAQRLLTKLGVTPTVVADGAAAVDAARGRRFDLILMDMMMPGVDGIAATEQIRAGDGPCREVPIIAFSAAAFEADRAAAARAGMNGFMEKPARLDSLRALLLEYLNRSFDPRSSRGDGERSA